MKNFILTLLSLSLIICSLSLEAKSQNRSWEKTPFVPGGIKHIKDRHWFNAQATPPTSRFNQSMTISKLNSMATRAIQQGSSTLSTNGKTLHEYTFKKPIGRATNGKRAHTLRVVTSPKGEIITAFPAK